ncbi:MAG: GNAT family N-acetyltransferase [Oscillospiraceae bacterium]|nr:GNAT family N-acetyltransferase [Oscillospiraceae bacterium]
MEGLITLEFRRASGSELEEVFRVFGDAIAEMDRNGIPQWDELYPDRAILAEDISKNELFIGMIGGEIACVFVINSECDEEYKNGAWQYPGASFRVIHRLCVNPRFQNRGIGAQTMRHIEAELKKEGVESIRFDAFTRNPYALRLYDKLGYARVGYADWRKGRFLLMEKKL